jgi:ABC-type amino acid transport substrate-binding protein
MAHPLLRCAAFCANLALLSPALGADLVLVLKEELVGGVPYPRRGDGVQVDMGKLLAAEMGRSLVVLNLPRNRYASAVESGEADLACSLMPAWMPGDFDWSIPFLPVVEVVLSAARVAPPATIADLKGKRIGTDTGFKYPEMVQELGKDFIRDDGPSAESSLRKMAAGRFDYMISTLAMYAEYKEAGALPLAMNPPLVVAEYKTQCAVSRRGRVSVQEFNNTLGVLMNSAAMQKILARNRGDLPGSSE